MSQQGGDQGDVKASSVAEGYAVFQIKNPSRGDDKFTLRIRLDATVDELRALISQTYEGRPPPSQQTLVYAGRVLNQSGARIKDFLRQHPDSSDPTTPHSLHLVVRPPAPAAPTPAPAPTPSPTPATPPSSTPTPLPSTPAPSNATPGPGSAPAHPPPPPAPTPPAASTSQPQQAPSSNHSQAPFFLVMNPVMAAAYQAAYTAALAAAANLHPETSGQGGSQAGPSALPWTASGMPPMAPPFAFFYANPQAGTSGSSMPNQYVTFPAVPAPYGMYPMGFPHSMPYAPMPQPAGPFQHDDGLAQRVPPGRGHTIVLHAQRVRGDRPVNRMRVFRFRLNLRVLLQLLVFVVLFYQHFTMSRFLVLMVGGFIIWATSSLAPLRRFVTGLLHPRPHAFPPPPGPPAAAPGAQPAGNQPPAPPPAADAAAGATPQPEGAQQPQPAAAAGPQRPPGLLREIALLLVGFVTSLIPGWHFNPEDAAAVAAAQQALAAQQAAEEEEQRRLLQQQQEALHAHQD